MNDYQSIQIEGSGLIIGFVSEDQEHLQAFKELNKNHTCILVNEKVSIIGLFFNLLIFTEDSHKMKPSFLFALKARITKN